MGLGGNLITADHDSIERFPVAGCPEQPVADSWSTQGLRTDGAKCPNHAVFLHNLTDDDRECCHLCNA